MGGVGIVVSPTVESLLTKLMKYSFFKRAEGFANFDKEIADQIFEIIRRFDAEDKKERKLDPEEYEPTIKIKFRSGEILNFSSFDQITEYRNPNAIIESIDISTSAYFNNQFSISIRYIEYRNECDIVLNLSTPIDTLHSFAVIESQKLLSEICRRENQTIKYISNFIFSIIASAVITFGFIYYFSKSFNFETETLAALFPSIYLLTLAIVSFTKTRFIRFAFPALEYNIERLKFSREPKRKLIIPLLGIGIAILSLLPVISWIANAVNHR